jgi:hypothetical protein
LHLRKHGRGPGPLQSGDPWAGPPRPLFRILIPSLLSYFAEDRRPRSF